MSGPTWTPGPWRLHADGYAVFAANGQQVIDAAVCSPNLTRAQILANARLIAAAPELAEALNDACDLLEGWITKHCHPRYVKTHMDDLARKRAVLAKARGES